MTVFARNAPFAKANPHALATILEASETRTIIASRDIFDISGIRIWPRDTPVSGALQRKLLDRRLRNPLESCLMADDGVTVRTLVLATQALTESRTPLAALLRPHAARLVEQAAQLPLHSVAQLLLTAGQAVRPGPFEHAVQAMALNGALMAAQGGTTDELHLAMLCGLLHDLGELYIDPRYGEADADRTLDFHSYRQLVVHPHVGQLLLVQLTNYPAALARAVAEHHERLDGSGYPHGLQRNAVSPLGRVLAVTEATLGVLRGPRPDLARACVALRVVPGEYDLGWVGHIEAAAGAAPESRCELDAGQVQARLARLDARLGAAADTIAVQLQHAQSSAMKDALVLSQLLLDRLRRGWHASGLGSGGSQAARDAGELEAIEGEFHFRLRSIERAARLRAGEVAEADAQVLERLCAGLAGAGS